MIKKEFAKKAYKLSSENNDEIEQNSKQIASLQNQILNIHTHTHSNKSILDQIAASYSLEEQQKLLGIESGANKNVQADWNQSDNSKDDFIQNKPNIPTKTSDITNDSGYITSSSLPTKTSDLTNDSGFITSSSLPTKVSDLNNDSGFITNSVDDLTNYYLKSEIYTQAEANNNFVPQTRTINGNALSSNISLGAGDIGAVPTTRTVNSKALSSNITLSASDVGAEPAFNKNTAFNQNFETSTSVIKMNGTVSVGSSNNIARADHTHPSDTTKQDVINSSNKLNADYINDSTSAKTLVSSSDRSTWNAKQNALSSSQLAAVNSGINSATVLQIGTNTTNIANKVDKVLTAKQVYATDGSGNQTALTYGSSQTNSANQIVQRDGNRDVLVPSTPTSNNSATSKSYVDGKTGIDKLWETSNWIQADYTGGQITLSADMANYSYILIGVKDWGPDGAGAVFYNVYKWQFSGINGKLRANSSNSHNYRRFTIDNHTQITFANGYVDGTATPQACLPILIYGVK